MSRLFALKTLAAMAMFYFIGCDVCTLADCSDHLQVRIVQHESEPTAVGTYDVLIQPEGAATINLICEVTADGGECQDQDGVDGGSPTDPDGGSTANGQLFVYIRESPKQMNIEVRSAGILLGEESFEPEYEKNKPNGPDCPPTCRRAEVTMLVDAPPQEE